MAPKILIATAIRSLGELIKQALEETGHYQAELANSGEQALELAPKSKFRLAIVDFGSIPNSSEIVNDLREINSKLHIVAMPFKDQPEIPENESELVDAWLSVPFYLPNLFETLENLIGNEQVEPPPKSDLEQPTPTSDTPKKSVSTQPAPEWLQDVNRVAQHLTRLSLESTAQAALITRGNRLWAYAGQLPQNAAEELAHSVGHIWAHNDGGSSDLARFIRLEAVNSDYMLYATSLGGDYVLALAFETEMSFTEMRVHAGELAQQLSYPPKDEPGPPSIQTTAKAIPVSNATETKEAEVIEESPQIPPDWRPDQEVSEGRQAFFEELLTSMDIPQPDGLEDSADLILDDGNAQDIALEELTPESIDVDCEREIDADTPENVMVENELEIDDDIHDVSEGDIEIVILDDHEDDVEKDGSPETDEAVIEADTEPEIGDEFPEVSDGDGKIVYDDANANSVELDEGLETDIDDDNEGKAEEAIDVKTPQEPQEIIIPKDYSWEEFNQRAMEMLARDDDTPVSISIDTPEIPPESLAETRPTAIGETVAIKRTAHRIPTDELESVHPSYHKLTYACVLVPRIPNHHLIGDIASYINQWAIEISLSYGWRLEHLAVRPDYLHWIAVLPPNSSPGLMVHNMQQEISQRIFTEFHRLEKENPSGEFWASGYLIVNGRDPFSRDMVHEFIDNVRAYQGAH